jgi:hypothetical protein
MTGKNNLVIKDILGKTIYKEIIISFDYPLYQLNDFQLPKVNGIYTLLLRHESGEVETFRFMK